MQAPAELEVFFRRERPRLIGALSLYTGDPSVAEELADEALTRACERWAEIQTMQAPGAWAYRVAINLAKSYFRRRQAEQRARLRATGGTDAVGPDGDAGDATAIRRATARLPPRQREAIVLRFYLDFSVAETAAHMDISDIAVRSLTHRAIETLRTQFILDAPQAGGR